MLGDIATTRVAVISDIKRLNNTFSTDGFSYNFGQSEGGDEQSHEQF